MYDVWLQRYKNQKIKGRDKDQLFYQPEVQLTTFVHLLQDSGLALGNVLTVSVIPKHILILGNVKTVFIVPKQIRILGNDFST